MEDASSYVVVSLVALIVGYLIGRRPGYLFQNSSEARLSRALQRRFTSPDYHLLNHVTLRTRGGTTQVDHILVSRFGVFVIETKDYKGWIFGNADDRYWTQVLFQARYRFRNPIRQNLGHVTAVRELLAFLPPDAIVSIVTFTGSAEFRTPLPDGVFYLKGLVSHLEGCTREVMTTDRLHLAIGRLEAARLAITKATDVEHVRQLRDRFGNDD